MTMPYAKMLHETMCACRVLRVAGDLDGYELAAERLEELARAKARCRFVAAVGARKRRGYDRLEAMAKREDAARERAVLRDGGR